MLIRTPAFARARLPSFQLYFRNRSLAAVKVAQRWQQLPLVRCKRPGTGDKLTRNTWTAFSSVPLRINLTHEIMKTCLFSIRLAGSRLAGAALRQRSGLALRLGIGAAITLSAALAAHGATTLHYWTGGSSTSGNWSSGANWAGGIPPVGGDQRLIFTTGAARKMNTNNLPAGTTFESIWVDDDGYNIYGNAVRINFLRGRCPTGTSTTFRPDLIAVGPLNIINETNNSTFHVLGDISLGANDLTFPSFSNPGDIIIGGVISGSGDVWKLNTGEVSFSGFGPNTYGGRTYVSKGVLRLNRYTIGLGLTLPGTTAIPGPLLIGDPSSTLIGNIVVLDRDNQIADTAAVTIYPTGSLELSDENETIGELVLLGGTVTTGSGNLAVEGNIRALPSPVVHKDSLIAGHLTLGTRGSGPQIIDVAQGVQLNVPAQISGVTSATLIKTNRGELVLMSSNVFSGDVELQGGMITVTHAHALGNTTGETKLLLGTLAINGTLGIAEPLVVAGPAGTLQVLGGSSSWLGDVTLEDDLTMIIPTNSTFTIVGQISGPAGWMKLGDGTLQFKTTYTHSYAGTSWVRDGNFIMDGVLNQPVIPGPFVIGNPTDPTNSARVWPIKQNQIADTSRITIEHSGHLEIWGFHDIVGSIEGTGLISLEAGGLLSVGRNNQSTTYDGVLSGAGTFQKVGSGVLTLTATNTLTGPIELAEGTLLVDGKMIASSGLHLNIPIQPPNAFPAVLGGNGSVSTIIPYAGGVIAPGSGPGRLTASGADLSGTEFRVELNGNTPGAGYDQLRVNGTVNLGQATLVIDAGYEPTTNDTFMVLEKVSAGAVVGTFANLPEGAVLAVGPRQFRVTYQGGNGNDVVLQRVDTPPLQVSSITAVNGEQMLLTGQGIPFATYVLDAAPTLNQPIPWMPIATNTANASGIYEFTDTFAAGGSPLYPTRYFRVRTQ